MSEIQTDNGQTLTNALEENEKLRQQLEQAEQSCRARIKADRLYCLEHGDEVAQEMARQLRESQEENERVRQANLDVMMHFEDMKACKEKAERRSGDYRRLVNWFVAATQKAEMNGYGQDSTHKDESWIDDLGQALDHAKAYLARVDQLERGEGSE